LRQTLSRPSKILASRRQRVGLLVDCTNTYGRAIVRGATRYANLQRRWLLFKDLERVFDLTSPWPKMDAAIIAGMSQEMLDHAIKWCHGRVVVCSGNGDPKISPVVALDDVAAGEQAAQHLMDCRIEHFAFYGLFPEYTVPAKRLAGFRSAVEARGFTCDVCPIERPTARDRMTHGLRPAVIKWLRELPKPVGVLAFDDTNAHDLAEACLEADIGVPDHVAIVGVNNDDLLCDSAWPPLSSVDADYARVGYTGAKMLDRMLGGEKLDKEERFVRLPPLGVVQRQSTNVLAVADPDLADACSFHP
jgi:LacI family transcriptional regulator